MKSVSKEHCHARLERAGYPTVTLSDGRRYFVDAAGLLDGLCPFEDNRGKRRIEFPYPKPAAVDIMAVMEWIDRRGLVRQKTATANSYSVKHWAERAIGRHIPNGAAVVAFDRAGFRQEMSPNGLIGAINTEIAIARLSYRNLPEVLGKHVAMNYAGGF